MRPLVGRIWVFQCLYFSTFIVALCGSPAASQVIVLVGNKCDLDRREVSYEEGAWFARQNGLLFMEASARTAHNVEAAFMDTARTIFENIQAGMYDLKSDTHGITVGIPLKNPGSSPTNQGGYAYWQSCCPGG